MTTQSDTVDISTLTKEDQRKIGGLDVTGAAGREPYINMLVYGIPGSGKTVLAGSANAVAAMSPVLVVDVEGGTFSLRATYPDVDVVRILKWADLQKVYNELYRGDSGYKTIVLDSLTEIQRLSMVTIMSDVVKEDNSRDPEVPSVREWGKNGEQLRRMVRAFRDLPMNVIFTALDLEDKDQKTGKVKHRPSLSGKMSQEVPGYMDICCYLHTFVVPHKDQDPEVRRFLLTGATDTHVAKDRSGTLPLQVEEPSMQSIHDIIFNGD